MRIAIGSDHRGFQIKGKLITLLNADGHEVEDYGTHSDQPVDYPDYAVSVAKRVAEGAAERGASCCDEVMAEMCRRHNDVNVLCLPGDLIGDRPVGDLVRVWLATEFEGGRHSRRIEKIFHIEGAEAAS